MTMLVFIYIFALAITGFIALVLVSAVRSPQHPEFNLFSSTAKLPERIVSEIRERLRMLMFGWEFPPFNSGGLGVACMGIVKGLSERNTDIAFVLPKRMPVSSTYARMRTADMPDVSMHAVNSSLAPYLDSQSYAKTADGSPLYGSDLVSEVHRYGTYGKKFAEEEAHDVIYAHDWLSFPAGMSAKRTSGKPFIAHVHATAFDIAAGDQIDQRIYDIERAGLHAADKVIAVSARTKDTIVNRYGVPAEKVSVVHNGIDESTAPKETESARLSALKDAGYQLVLFLGRITVQKGPDYFLRAATGVLKERPRTYFLVAGAGSMEHQIIEQAAALGIADKVIFTGFLRGDEQYEAYKAADLFVMPSVSEPFGITALEAMRIGTPAIISKQSGVAEAVQNAIAVDFWDVEQLTAQMLRVLSNPTLASELSRKGVEEVKSLTWTHAAEKIRDVTDGLVHPLPVAA